jgi:hypothetical protein
MNLKMKNKGKFVAAASSAFRGSAVPYIDVVPEPTGRYSCHLQGK